MSKVLSIIGIYILFGVGYDKKLLSPKIEFDESEVDFGEVKQNTELTHIFKFRNVGADTLVINKTRSP